MSFKPYYRVLKFNSFCIISIRAPVSSIDICRQSIELAFVKLKEASQGDGFQYWCKCHTINGLCIYKGNYNMWKIKMWTLLLSRGLWEVVDKGYTSYIAEHQLTMSETTDGGSKAHGGRQNERCQRLISNSVGG